MINFALFAGTITPTTNVDRLCRSELLSIANDRCTSRSLIGRRVNNVCAFNTHQPSTIRVVSDHTRADNWCAFVYSLCGGLRSACADHRDVFSIQWDIHCNLHQTVLEQAQRFDRHINSINTALTLDLSSNSYKLTPLITPARSN